MININFKAPCKPHDCLTFVWSVGITCTLVYSWLKTLLIDTSSGG